MRYYAGIGSRETPPDIYSEMGKVSMILEKAGFTLRSGNASGADQAFAFGVCNAAQIWLPWKSFNDKFRSIRPYHDYRVISEFDTAAFESVYEFHPNAKNLSEASHKFMARNYRQMIGVEDEPNSEFVICWTREGLPIGGTGFALRIAKKRGVRVINMFHFPTAKQAIEQLTIYGEI